MTVTDWPRDLALREADAAGDPEPRPLTAIAEELIALSQVLREAGSELADCAECDVDETDAARVVLPLAWEVVVKLGGIAAELRALGEGDLTSEVPQKLRIALANLMDVFRSMSDEERRELLELVGEEP
ncbi:MAG TPA: hypothetical protein VFA12_20580 [Stellaceae bacterium]|nr:hypothetical protein [Stellaceae bacterium]